MPGDSKRVICVLVATFSYMEQESVEGEDILKHTRGLNKIEICSYFTIKPYILDTCSSRSWLIRHFVPCWLPGSRLIETTDCSPVEPGKLSRKATRDCLSLGVGTERFLLL